MGGDAAEPFAVEGLHLSARPEGEGHGADEQGEDHRGEAELAPGRGGQTAPPTAGAGFVLVFRAGPRGRSGVRDRPAGELPRFPAKRSLRVGFFVPYRGPHRRIDARVTVGLGERVEEEAVSQLGERTGLFVVIDEQLVALFLDRLVQLLDPVFRQAIERDSDRLQLVGEHLCRTTEQTHQDGGARQVVARANRVRPEGPAFYVVQEFEVEAPRDAVDR